jgi:diguanylate cyclase (GGDEF)-like protein
MASGWRAVFGWGNSVIGRRIVALVVLSVVLAIVTVTGIFMWLQLRDGIESRKSEIEATGYVFASAIADHVAVANREAALKVLRSITRVPDISYATATDDEGREIAALGSAVLAGNDLTEKDAGLLSMLGRGSFPVAVAIVKSGRKIGSLVIVADISKLRGQLLRAAVATLIAAFAAGSAGLAVALRFQKRITAPIISLTGAMRRVKEARDYSAKVEHVSDDETGVLVDSFNAMIAEIGSRDKALERLAYYDPLTGTANRQLFQQKLEQLLAHGGGGTNTALFLLDLDGFKLVNDTFGHSVGDALLIAVAALVRERLPENTLVARLGGDEFALIAYDIAAEEAAENFAARIMAAFLQPVMLDKREIFVSTSIGIAMIPRDGANPEDLLRRADLALYGAKREGLGRVKFYRPALDHEVQQRSEIARDLRLAMETGGLEAHYQPQVDLVTGEVTGFESLLRWKHPTRGYISPGVFVPIAEEANLICDLGRWMLRESCRQAKAWLDAGLPPRPVSVNVSMAQIRRAEFHDDFANILEESGLPARLLCLELTESLFIGGARRRVRYVLEALKQAGVILAIDDFGTGYSSLSYLQELPFDRLKIDRAFISGVDTNLERRRLLKGIVDLGHALGKSLVAEGAETAGEVAVLREMRADQVQGYFFSRALPAAEASLAATMIPYGFSTHFPAFAAGPVQAALQLIPH